MSDQSEQDVPRSGDNQRTDEVIGEITPFDPAPSLTAAATALEQQGARFALIGGFALEAWGIPRATKDIDLAVPTGVAESAAESLRAATTDVRPLRIGGVGIRDNERGLRIDLIDRRFHFGPLFQDAIREAVLSGRKARVGDRNVSLVSLEFLVAMKLVSGEPKDDADVRRLLQRVELKYAAAREIVESHLGAASANRLDAMAREVGRPEVSPARLYRNGEEPE